MRSVLSLPTKPPFADFISFLLTPFQKSRMPDLPAEVLTELLIRLPVDSIFSARSVSKRWCALIDGQDFVKAHLCRLVMKQSLVFGGGMGILHTLNDFDDGSVVKSLNMPFKKHCFTWLRGSCNGLLLLERDGDIFLLNPSTREFVKLPDCPFEFPVEGDDFDINKESCGLGYDSINDDYKVVKVVEFSDRKGVSLCSKTRVYSSKSNCWGRVQDFPYSLPDFLPFWGANVGGALHTSVQENRELVVGFDLSREKSYSVPLPQCFDKKFGSLHVMVFDGCLCLLGGYINLRTDVWVMKEYGVKESWIKLFSIAPPTVQPYISIVPLLYSGDRGEVLLNYDNKKLIWYDLKRRTVRDALIQNLPEGFYAEVLVESLVPVRGFAVTKKKAEQVDVKGKKDNKKSLSGGFLSTGFKLKL